jgi:hypothetical protein
MGVGEVGGAVMKKFRAAGGAADGMEKGAGRFDPEADEVQVFFHFLDLLGFIGFG